MKIYFLQFRIQIVKKKSQIDLPAVSKEISVTILTVIVFLLICSACEELKGQFEDLNIYLRCKWYRYPAKLQRILTIILIDSQNSDAFKIFGSLTASRETCKKVSYLR